MRIFSSLPLSTRLTILAAATLFPLAVLLVLADLNNRDEHREEALTEARTYTETTATALDTFASGLDNYMAAAAIVLGSENQAISGSTASGYLKNLIGRYENFSALFITDPSGRVTAQHTGDDSGFDTSSRPYTQALQAGAEYVWSGGLTGIRSGEVTAVYGRQIKNPDGSVKGFLIAAFRPSNLTDYLPPDFPEDANLVIIDQNGSLIYSTRDPDFQGTSRDVSGSPITQRVLSGETVHIEGESTPFDSGERYGAVAPVPMMGWAAGYTRSQSTLDASLQSDLLRDLAVVGGIILVTLAAVFLAARQLSLPLNRLAGAAADIAEGRRVQLPPLTSDPDVARLQQAFSSMSTAVAEREDRLSEQARVLETLEQVGAWIASDLDFEKTLQAVTDAGTRLTEAQLGAFFFNSTDEKGEAYQLYTISGVDRSAFADLPMPGNTAIFGPTFSGQSIMRLHDVTLDERYGKNPPYKGMPEGHVPVRSYLAVPVFSSRRGVIGGLIFGHERAGIFTERHEKLATGLASWAAIALDNARLYSESQADQESLRQANRSKDEFLGLVSHELRTPTTTIYGGMRLLETRRNNLGTEAASELISSMSEESARLVRLIENLLAFARMELKQDLDMHPLEVNTACSKVIAAFSKTHLDREVRTEFAENLSIIHAEPIYFEQILQNLLTNADKYSPQSTPILVTTRQRDGELQILVADNGKGVPQDETEKIFDSFYRSREASELASGHGLGLTVCKRLMEAQDGRIWAENRPEGGLQVGFAFPLPAN